MPPHLIEKEPRKWKKDEWKKLPCAALALIKFNREVRIRKTHWLAWNAGVNPIYPSDDDDLDYKERK
jgi:hypothetical protein